MRGTGYAIAEIVWWLLIAAAIGFVIGWILRKWSMGTRLDTEWEERFSAQEAQASRLEADLTARATRVEELEADLAAARTSLETTAADLTAKSRELDAATTRLSAETAGAQTSAARLAELETLSGERQARITLLEAELAAASTTPAGGELVASASDAQVAETAVAIDPGAEQVVPPGGQLRMAAGDGIAADPPNEPTATARVAEIAARTRGDGPAVDDDLQDIRGVGPELERMLKNLGITSYRQVARFTTDDIAFVTAALGAFPGRIERDDWMTSAAAAHLEKYGESA